MSVGRVAETGKPLIIDDYRKWEGAASISGATELGAEISVPMIWRGQVTGVIQAIEDSATRQFTQSDLDLLMAFANHAAIAVENTRVEEELKRHSRDLEELVDQRTRRLGESERELGSTKERLEYVIASNPAVIYSGRPLPDHSDWHLTYLSENVVTVLGYGPREFIGHPEFWESHVHPEDLLLCLAEVPRLWEEGRFTFEYRFLHKDGRYRWIRDEANLVRDAKGEPREVNGYWTNVTELKHLEEQLIKAERLVAIGETAAMVGHDLRNPLQAISAAAYVLDKKLTPAADTETREMLEAVKNSVAYSDKIVNDLLEYSEDIQLELSETTPKAIAKDAFLHVKIPENISVLDSTSDDLRLRVDTAKVRRVFVNLIENAVDSMPNGGKLAIISNKSNNYVELKLSDTGAVIPENVLRELWKPFITTKPKGIGLGLAICKRIADSHKGSISVDSREGIGTTFTLKLPLTTGQEGADRT